MSRKGEFTPAPHRPDGCSLMFADPCDERRDAFWPTRGYREGIAHFTDTSTAVVVSLPKMSMTLTKTV